MKVKMNEKNDGKKYEKMKVKMNEKNETKKCLILTLFLTAF